MNKDLHMVREDLRMTMQRRAILEELRRVDSHPTADEVYEMVRQRLPHISLGTVYRNLELLSRHGMIQKLEGGGQRRFDGFLENHYHVRCLRCGRVDDVEIEPIAAVDDVLQGLTEYEVVGYKLEFVGLCPQCRQKGQHAHRGLDATEAAEEQKSHELTRDTGTEEER